MYHTLKIPKRLLPKKKRSKSVFIKKVSSKKKRASFMSLVKGKKGTRRGFSVSKTHLRSRSRSNFDV